MVRLDASREVKCVKIRGDLAKERRTLCEPGPVPGFFVTHLVNAQSLPCPVRPCDIKNQKGCFHACLGRRIGRNSVCEASLNHNAAGRPHFPEPSGPKKTGRSSRHGKRLLLVCHCVHRLFPDCLSDHAGHAIPLPHGRRLNVSFAWEIAFRKRKPRHLASG